MIKENEWDNENHELLYALFILEANRAINIINRPSSWGEEQAVHVAMFNYMFQWEDRAVCEEEFEGYTFITPDEFKKSYMILRPQRASKDQLKIKFRFVENEND